jgi:hypothetical protein
MNQTFIFTLFVGIILGLIFYRWTVGWILRKVSRFQGLTPVFVVLVQIVYLLFVGGVIIWWITPNTIEWTQAALTESPTKRTEHYYAEISKGIEHMQFWRAYDLWSGCQRQQRLYEDFLVSHAQTERFELVRTEALEQTADRARVLAVVKLVRAVNGMLVETDHWVYYLLKKEGNEWRMDSFQQFQEVPQNDLNLPADYQVCR